MASSFVHCASPPAEIAGTTLPHVGLANLVAVYHSITGLLGALGSEQTVYDGSLLIHVTFLTSIVHGTCDTQVK